MASKKTAASEDFEAVYKRLEETVAQLEAGGGPPRARSAGPARRKGIPCAAVTDHNTIQGALAVREIAGSIADPMVIVGAEIRSRDGEIIGLFLSEEVP